jgi:hypothetical protein
MRLLNVHTLNLEFFQENEGPLGGYTILSHAWAEEEVSFKDLTDGNALHLRGYQKIMGCCELSKREGFDYTWIDTCCINKDSSAELSEAINSMFKWYYTSRVCYAYLGDAYSVFAGSRWFTRGWTLQELIAPDTVVFLDADWKEIGTRQSLAKGISGITGIPTAVLDPTDFRYPPHEFLERYTVAQRMSWAATRQTTRIEDEAYCLLGIFNVSMPLLYGEGRKAFQRLQRQIMEETQDISLYAWQDTTLRHVVGTSPLLASSPGVFQGCGNITLLQPSQWCGLLTPTKRSLVSHFVLRLAGSSSLGTIDRLMTDNPWLGESAEKDHDGYTFYRNWKDVGSWPGSNSFHVLVLNCGIRSETYSILVLGFNPTTDSPDVLCRLHSPTRCVDKPDLLKFDKRLGRQLEQKTFDVELTANPPMLAPSEFQYLFEKRGVKVLLRGHKAAGYCLDKHSTALEGGGFTETDDIATVWLEQSGHLVLRGEPGASPEPGALPWVIIPYAYEGTWTPMEYMCYTCTEPNLPDDIITNLRYDNRPFWHSRQVPEMTLQLGDTRHKISIKPRVSSWSCTIMVSVLPCHGLLLQDTLLQKAPSINSEWRRPPESSTGDSERFPTLATFAERSDDIDKEFKVNPWWWKQWEILSRRPRSPFRDQTVHLGSGLYELSLEEARAWKKGRGEEAKRENARPSHIVPSFE